MKAQLVQDHSRERKILADIVPLSAPLSLTVLASSICNLKCKYCVHGSGASWLEKVQKSGHFLKLETAKKMIDGLKASCKKGAPKLCRITYAGYGEPLLNPEIADIIAYTKQSQVCEEVVVVTNAVALTSELSDKLINAGLDLMRISIQGITAKEYLEQSGQQVDIEKLGKSIQYYYLHKKAGQRVYIKIMNEQLKSDEERTTFLKMFAGCCDEIAFESLAPVLTNASEEDINRFQKGINTGAVAQMRICPLPFYSLHVMTDGKITTCCYYDHAAILGNVCQQSIQEVWEGEPYREFLKGMLADAKCSLPVCGGCKAYAYTMRIEDSVDAAQERLCEELGVCPHEEA